MKQALVLLTLLVLPTITNVAQKPVPVADVFSYIFDDGRLQSVDLKNRLKNVGINFDNNLNKATYGAKLAEILTDSENVSRSPAEVAVFSDTVSRFFVSEN